ncbi:ABC transporter substrate-binding protein [Actinophytocola sp.]|uniref:ABC transporter substrate-binding protein n=1 Tax=Actinophytocola sp. TaxID=1872138 RepID=UPI003D6AE0AC
MTSVNFATATTPLSLGIPLLAVAADTFAEHGLDVTYTQTRGSTDTVAAMLNGDLDVAALGSSAVVAAIGEGADFVFLGGGAAPANIVLLRPDKAEESGVSENASPRERIQALRGLKIGTATAGSANDLFLRLILQAGGLDPDRDVTIINVADFPTLSDGLTQGQYDAVSHAAGVGLERNILDGSGLKWISLPDGDVPEIGALFASVAATRNWVEQNPEAADAVYQSLNDAYAMFDDDAESAGEMLRTEYYSDTDPEAFQLGFELNAPTWSPNAKITKELFDGLIKSMNESGETDYSDIAYEDIVLKAAQE